MTVIAFNFEGGSDLSLKDVLPYVKTSLGRISSVYCGTDIMAKHAGQSARRRADD